MLKLVCWDVQHGSATYIGLPNGQHMVIDLGTGSLGSGGSAFSPLLYLRDRWSVAQLDLVVITHPHRDHLDDIANFDALRPRVLTRPRHLSEQDIRSGNQQRDRNVIDKYIELDRRFVHPVAESTSPFTASYNGGVSIQTFIPQSCPRGNLNNHSVVVVIEYLGCKFLLPGDNEAPSWQELLQLKSFRDAISGTHILLAPHHGRKAGFCSDLFNHIAPLLTIISDGPYCETSATDVYGRHTQGWQVDRRNGAQEQRKCVTTRCDGAIFVACGPSNAGPYIGVTVD